MALSKTKGIGFASIVLAGATALWLVFSADRPSDERDVARELARRAAAGDPVTAEELEWSEERPGLHWSTLSYDLEEEREERLRDLDGMKRRSVYQLGLLKERLSDSAALPDWTNHLDASAFWSRDEAGLASALARLDWLQRDPDRWRDASLEERVARWARSGTLQDGAFDNCELGRPDGLHAFGWDAPYIGLKCNFYDSDEPQPPTWWESAQTARTLARMDALAMLGDAGGVLEFARSMLCLQRAFSDLTNRWRAEHRMRIDRGFVRQVDACLPLLEGSARRELLAVLEGARDEDWSLAFERALRAQRAGYHRYYEVLLEEYADRREGGERDRYEGGPFIHDQFLSYLAVQDEVFAAVRLPSFADRVARLRSIEALSGDEQFHFWAFDDREGLTDEYVTALEVESLRRCAAVGAAYLSGGSASAEEVAATLPDPLTDDPLRTRVRDDGVFEVWSVGPDLVDDGGSTAGAPGEPDRDVVFRVPLD